MTGQLGCGKRSERPTFPVNTMRSIITIIACLLTAWLIGCESATGPKDGNKEFLFRVEVSDADGKPVPNLRISGYNELTGIDPFFNKTHSLALEKPSPAAVTSIPFVVAEKSQINFSAFDMNDDLIDVLTDQILREGPYTVAWSTGREPPPGIYRCQVTARDTLTGESIFEDSIYAVNWQVDPEIGVYGFTNSVGVFETANDLLFPNVLDNLPVLTHTDETGETVGTFRFEDTVVITLTDTATHDTMRLQRVVKTGKNTFSVVWAPGSQSISNSTCASSPVQIPARPRDVDPPVFEWRLGQNYPNPYN